MNAGVSRFAFFGLVHVACYCLNSGPLLVTSTDLAERRRLDRLRLALGFLNQGGDSIDILDGLNQSLNHFSIQCLPKRVLNLILNLSLNPSLRF